MSNAKRLPGRPRLAEPKVYPIGSMRLRPGEDDDLIQFFEAIPKRKRRSAIKQALRVGGMQSVRVNELGDDEELTKAAVDFLS